MTSCRRAWEVEAVRDERLVGSDRARTDRHVATCASCAQERRDLELLGRELRALPAPSLDQVTLRRRRQQLLTRAQDMRRARPARAWARFAVAFGVVGALSLGALALRAPMRSRVAQSSLVPRNTADSAHEAGAIVQIKAAPGTLYARSAEAGLEIVRLDHGTIWLQVRGKAAGRNVLVRTPDGEISDRGTTFYVTVLHSETRDVAVSEGSVWVQIAGRAPRMLHAGERYQPYVKEASDMSSREVRKLHSRHVSESSGAKERVRLGAADVLFQQGMEFLQNGQPRHAARLFAEFSAMYSSDSRAEDATFLRVVALSRAQLPDEARAAARVYLDRYPLGLRVREIESLLQQ